LKIDGLDDDAEKRVAEVVSTATLRRRNFHASFNPDTLIRRPITGDDLPEIVDARGSGGTSRNSPPFRRARSRRLEYLQKNLDDRGSIGVAAWDGSVLAGFLELRPLKGHPLWNLYPVADAVMIGCAHYHSSYGSGVCKVLLSDLFEGDGWPAIQGKNAPGQLISLLPPSATEREVDYYIDCDFIEAAVTDGFIPGYRVFALPRKRKRLKKFVMHTSVTGLDGDVLYVPDNPMCHISLWAAENLRTVAGHMGIKVESRDFLAGWSLPAPVAIYKGRPLVDINHRRLDEKQARTLLESGR